MKNINLKPRRDRRILRVLATSAVLAVLLSACGKSADEYISRAQALRDQGDLPAAVIELKNALQKEPRNLTARVMLGQTYLDMSDPVNAETDLLRARADGADAALLARPLAETELLLGKFDKALTESEFPANASPALKASLYSIRALAYATQGKSGEADNAFAAGLKEDPHSADILLALVRYAIGRHDLATARARLADAEMQAPTDVRFMALKGTIAFADGRFPDAEEAFSRVAKAQAWNIGARADLAQAQVAEGKLKEADANLAIVLRAAPKAPRPNYLRALTAFQEQDYTTANARIQSALGGTTIAAPALLLGGAISYALNQYEQANSYLNQYVAREPQDVRGRRLLGAVQIKLGHPADAVKTLSPALVASGNDAQLLAIIGEAAARSGDAAGADKYLTLALQSQPDNAAIRTELGLTKASLGQTDAAIEELERASKQDPDAVGPDAALFATYLRNKDYDKALEIAERLQSKQPKKTLGFDLAGVAYIGKGDYDAAQGAFLKATEQQPNDGIALHSLAALATQAGKFDMAIGYLETLTKANPKDVQASIGLAQLQLGQGKADIARATLQSAMQQNPDDARVRIVLARLSLLQGNGQAALSVAEPALAKYPRQPDLLEVVAQAQLADGRTEAALTTLKVLVEVAPQSSSAHRELSGAYAAAHDLDKSLSEARTALQLAPDDRAAKLALGSLLVSTRNYDEARQRIDEWASSSPQDLEFTELQGIVASAQNRLQDAVDAFTRGLGLLDNSVTRTRLALAQAEAGLSDQAIATLTTSLDKHPDDNTMRAALAGLYLREKRTVDARDQYAQILRQAPNDVVAENNLAWTMSVLGQKDEALAHARHAATAAPDMAGVLDTLGVILLQNGSTSEARDALAKAAKNAPDVASIQFHLAQALVATGDKSKAREILRPLLANNARFEERDQARSLLDQLSH